MKISEIIEELQKIYNEEGDLDVYRMLDEYGNCSLIKTVYCYESEDKSEDNFGNYLKVMAE